MGKNKFKDNSVCKNRIVMLKHELISYKKRLKSSWSADETQSSLDIDLNILNLQKGCLRSCYKTDKGDSKFRRFCEELWMLKQFENFCDFFW